MLGRRLGQRGDTIVEVLIAVLVLSLVLTTAYGLATRSTQDNQQTQEHSQALKLAQAQLESLKAYYDRGQNPTSGQLSNGFCFDSTDTLQTFTASNEPSLTTPDTLTYGITYPKICTSALSGQPCLGTGVCFFYGIRQSNDVYTASVRWPGARGTQDQVSLIYRVYR